MNDTAKYVSLSENLCIQNFLATISLINIDFTHTDFI